MSTVVAAVLLEAAAMLLAAAAAAIGLHRSSAVCPPTFSAASRLLAPHTMLPTNCLQA
jgi:hypothetical protein